MTCVLPSLERTLISVGPRVATQKRPQMALRTDLRAVLSQVFWGAFLAPGVLSSRCVCEPHLAIVCVEGRSYPNSCWVRPAAVAQMGPPCTRTNLCCRPSSGRMHPRVGRERVERSAIPFTPRPVPGWPSSARVSPPTPFTRTAPRPWPQLEGWHWEAAWVRTTTPASVARQHGPRRPRHVCSHRVVLPK